MRLNASALRDRMGMENRFRFIKFGVVGVLNTALDFFVFVTLIRIFDWDPLVANCLSYSVAVSNSYVLNLIWTFRGKNGASFSLQSFLTFVAVNSVGFLIGTFVIWQLKSVVVAELAKIFAIGLTLVWNFCGTKYFVIDRRKKNE